MVELTWKGTKVGTYYVIAMDFMEEKLFVKETAEARFVFDGQPHPNLILQVFAGECHFSNYVILRKNDGKIIVTR